MTIFVNSLPLLVATAFLSLLIAAWCRRAKRSQLLSRLSAPRRRSGGAWQWAQTLESRTLLSAAPLVGHWEFSEGAGVAAADSSPSGSDNSGTLQDGVTWEDGAVRFNGQRSRIAIADTPDINTATHAQRTVALQFQADDVEISSRKQILYEEGGAGKGLNIYLHDGQLYAGIWSSKNGGFETFLATDQIESGEWHQVTVVLDGGDDVGPDAFRAYLDGEEFGSGDAAELAAHGGDIGFGSVNQSTLYHDGDSGSRDDTLGGALDDIRVYNSSLSAAEIAELVAGPPNTVSQLSLVFSSSVIDENGGTVVATLEREGDTTDALEVTLTSDDNDRLSIPDTVIIGAGESSTTFSVTSIDNDIANDDLLVEVTVLAAGFEADSSELLIENDDPIIVGEPIVAFAGAEGFGAMSVGGRGGEVYEVTNLNDSGAGSLREALEAEGPRTVVFRTGGTIELETPLVVTNPYLTIAGQTAPGNGITLRNGPNNTQATLGINTHDVIVRYITVRSGPADEESAGLDGILVFGAENVMIDHVSISWAVDENFSTYFGSHDVTLQNSFITEGLHDSNHVNGPHSKGALIGDPDGYGISVHNNLFAHNDDRNPLINLGGTAQVVNNVVYNSSEDNPEQAGPSFARNQSDVNYIGNYFQAGPDTIVDEYFISARETEDAEFYVEGNITPLRTSNNADETTGVVKPEDLHRVVDQPFDGPEITTVSAADARDNVLAGSGNSAALDELGRFFERRDAIDQRIAQDVVDGTGSRIDDPSDVGGWLQLAAGTPPTDTDHDGMPDAWEILYGFDPLDGQDGRIDSDGDGYTNLEHYLNGDFDEISDPPASLTLDISDATLSEPGEAATATITRTGDVTDELVVTLVNGDSTELNTPSQVTIAAGSPFATFQVTAQNDDVEDGPQSVLLKASADGVVGATLQVVVLDDDTVVDPPVTDVDDAELVAHWEFSEGTGTVASDTSAFGEDNSADLQDGVTWENGAVRFDGDRSRIAVPDTADINTAEYAHRTVSLQFQADDVTTGSQKQVLYEEGGGQKGLNVYLLGGRLYVGIWSSTNGGFETYLSTDQVESGQWHQVTLVLDAEDDLAPDTFRAYLDGEQFGSGAAMSLPAHGGDIGLGSVNQSTKFHDGDNGSRDDTFAGLIDDIRVYNRSLSDEEVEALN